MDERPFLYAPGVHLSLIKPPRVVPGPERHRWANKNVKWGESTSCLKCGCEKLRLKTQPDYTERYRLAGTTELLVERPACTGILSSPKRLSHAS